MTLEQAEADVSCLMEERGTQFALNRFGVTMEDVESAAFLTGEDLVRTATLIHEFSLANTYLSSGGRRACRACTARRQREYQARQRSAA